MTSLLYVAYLSLMASNSGQTLGKMLLDLRVEGSDGREPNLAAAFQRNAGRC